MTLAFIFDVLVPLEAKGAEWRDRFGKDDTVWNVLILRCLWDSKEDQVGNWDIFESEV